MKRKLLASKGLVVFRLQKEAIEFVGTSGAQMGWFAYQADIFATAQDIALAVFTAIVQGILVAGLSTYVN